MEIKQDLTKALFIDGYTIDDKYDGNYLEYHTNGKIRFEGAYKDDLRIGIWKEYNLDGIIITTGEFSNGGIKIGYWESYYDDGSPKYKGNLNNDGEKIGKWTYWDEDGKKTKEKF